MRTKHSAVAVGLWLAAVAAAVSPAAYAGGIDDFTLTRAIPADVFMAAHSRSHDGQAFLKAQYARVWEALENSGIDKDIKRMVMSLAEGEGDKEEAERLWTQMSDLLAGVEWATLGEREFAFAMKLGAPLFDMVFLFMPPEDEIAGDFTGLAAILKTLADLAPNDLALTEDDSGDTQVRALSPKNAPIPMAVTLARHKNVIMLAAGGSMGEQVLAMLKEPAGQTLASTERFAAAFKNLPAPTDSLTFLDLARMMSQIRKLSGDMMDMMPAPAPDAPDYEQYQTVRKLPGKIIDQLDMFEYLAEVATTRDKRTTTDITLLLRDGASEKPLYKAFFGNGTLQDPLKYIPATAGSFSVTSGIDFLALYKEVTRFIQNEIPEGADAIAQLEKAQADAGISVENDILGWIRGGFTSFDVPGPGQFSAGEFAFMLSVRDEAKAREMLGKLFDLVGPMLQQQNGTIEVAAIEGVEGFRSVLHPMLGMVQMTRPTLGVHDGQLMFGSSPKVLTSALEVGAGKGDNFAKNERFRSEGLTLGANVTSISFSDTSRTGQDLSQMLKMVPMIGMMAGQELQRNPALGAGLRIISKLAPVVEKLDFFLSDCSQTTFDGKVITTQTVSNYREPPSSTPAETPSENSSNGGR